MTRSKRRNKSKTPTSLKPPTRQAIAQSRQYAAALQEGANESMQILVASIETFPRTITAARLKLMPQEALPLLSRFHKETTLASRRAERQIAVLRSRAHSAKRAVAKRPRFR